MRRGACVVIALAALTAGSAAGGPPRLRVVPLSPIVGERTTIELQGQMTAPVVALMRSPHGVSSRVRLRSVRKALWRGDFTFPSGGQWTVRVDGVTRLVLVGARQPVPPESSFVPLGAPGCAPPSPANTTTREAKGSGSLWAFLFVDLHQGGGVVLENVIGKDTKIAWRMLGSGDMVFTAIAPDGTTTRPKSVQAHGGSTWNRPGDEWGTIFVFSHTGCWQIHADRGNASGDLWVRVDS